MDTQIVAGALETVRQASLSGERPNRRSAENLVECAGQGVLDSIQYKDGPVEWVGHIFEFLLEAILESICE